MRIAVDDPYDLGEEFFRWEIATAVAGSILGINPFDQPDVEASKIATRQLTAEYEKTGVLPAETPILVADGIKLFTDRENAAALRKMAGRDDSLWDISAAHLNRLGAGDYCRAAGLYQMNEAHEGELQAMRQSVRDAKRVATCLGFGPRFLHSTDSRTRVGQTRACSCRSLATTRSTCLCRANDIRSAWSRRPKHEAISRFCCSATGACCALISAPMCEPA